MTAADLPLPSDASLPADSATGVHRRVELPACPDCPEAARRAREYVGSFTLECTCGRSYRVRRVAAPSAELLAYSAPLASAAEDSPSAPRPARRRTFRADPAAPSPERTPEERARHLASRPSERSEAEREFERVQMVLGELRPDHPHPWEPMPKPEAGGQTIRVRDPSASWGGIPRGFGLGAQLEAAALFARPDASAVMARLASLPPDAAAVLRWMRLHGSLGQGLADARLAVEKALRGFYVDAALAFPTAKQSRAWGLALAAKHAEEREADAADASLDAKTRAAREKARETAMAPLLTARRDGAPKHGRDLILRACGVWEAQRGGRTP